MIRLLKYLLILVLYELFVTFTLYLFLDRPKTIIFFTIFNFALLIYMAIAGKFIAGFLQAKKITKSGHKQLFLKYQKASHKFHAMGVDVYSYESNEINSMYISSLLGKNIIFLSSALINELTMEEIEVHFTFQFIKQKYKVDSCIEALVSVLGLFNLQIISLILYPFDRLASAFQMKQIQYLRKSIIAFYVPIFSFFKNIILEKNLNHQVYSRIQNVGIDQSNLVSALLKSNATIENEMFRMDLMEYSKFLSHEFNVEESNLL